MRRALFLLLLLVTGCEKTVSDTVGARVVYWENGGDWARCSNREPFDYPGHWVKCEWRCAVYHGEPHHVVVLFPDAGDRFGRESVETVDMCK